MIWYSGALIQLLQNPYFRRVWIIQEIALSQDLEFHIGSDYVSMKELAAAAATLSTIDFGSKNSRTLSYILAIRSRVRGQLHANPQDVSPRFFKLLGERVVLGHGILSLMSLFRGSRATKEADKIFGLLGLCRELENAHTLGIKEEDYNPDEKKEVIYRQAAISILRETGDLSLFAGLKFQPTGGSKAMLPTWVPDVCISSSIQICCKAITK
jgi:hypothetical protein